MKIASVADVKAKLSGYIEASKAGPVIVTKNGKPAAVLLSMEDEEEIERAIGLFAKAAPHPANGRKTNPSWKRHRAQRVLGGVFTRGPIISACGKTLRFSTHRSPSTASRQSCNDRTAARPRRDRSPCLLSRRLPGAIARREKSGRSARR